MLEKQADFYFAQGRFLLAANYYAQAETQFETVVLKYMNISSATIAKLALEVPSTGGAVGQSDSARFAKIEGAIHESLRSYLIQKFKKLPAESATQRTLIATWLLEMFLRHLNTKDFDEQKEAYMVVQAELFEWLLSPGVKVFLTVGIVCGHIR